MSRLCGFQSTKDNLFYIVDIGQQQFDITASKSYQNSEVGIGLWYDTSLYDAYKNGYMGKTGILSAFTFLKTGSRSMSLRLGVVRYIDQSLSDEYFGRFQLITRFHKYKN